MSFLRQIKNLTLYTIAQTKVRNVTSNDGTFPPIEKFDEIAQLTFDPRRFTEIMEVIWKRLNDGGKSWRHVFKALNLLEYLLKAGNPKVADVCQENIFLICMLQTYQCMEDKADRGAFVRAKAELIFKLLNNSELLAKEREKAAKLMQEKEQQKLKNSPKKSQESPKKRQSEDGSKLQHHESLLDQINTSSAQHNSHPTTSTPLSKGTNTDTVSHFSTSQLISIPEVGEICPIDVSKRDLNPFVDEKALVTQEHPVPAAPKVGLSPIINANTMKQAPQVDANLSATEQV